MVRIHSQIIRGRDKGRALEDPIYRFPDTEREKLHREHILQQQKCSNVRGMNQPGEAP